MRRLLLLLAVLGLAGGLPSASAHPLTVELSADAAGPALAATNRSLVGVGWDWASFTPSVMAPLRPDLVRLDASLERLWAGGEVLDVAAYQALEGEVADILAIGGEPLVILSYLPAWLAARPFGDPTRQPPGDVAAWGRIVEATVLRLVRAGVRWFEVWNEPDWPPFYQGTMPEFLDRIFAPSAQASARVEEETGVDLRFGGCACLFPDPAWMLPMILYAQTHGLPLDFLSWHYYGNYPFTGPDGPEPIGGSTERSVAAALGQRNPVAGAAIFSDQVEMVRGWRDALYAGRGRLPELVLDEWNLSAGGFDLRHDTAAGASFDAAVLVELQRSGLDRAAFFRSVDHSYGTDVVPSDPELYGGWGLVGRRGTIKPAWHAFALWGQLGGEVLGFTSPSDARAGVSALLTRRGPGSLRAYAASFQASAAHDHVLRLQVTGAPGTWTVRARSPGRPDAVQTVTSTGTLVADVALPAQSFWLVELDRTP